MAIRLHPCTYVALRPIYLGDLLPPLPAGPRAQARHAGTRGTPATGPTAQAPTSLRSQIREEQSLEAPDPKHKKTKTVDARHTARALLATRVLRNAQMTLRVRNALDRSSNSLSPSVRTVESGRGTRMARGRPLAVEQRLPGTAAATIGNQTSAKIPIC